MKMFKTILLIIIIVTVLSFGSSRNAPATSLDLSKFLWKNRLLFLFAPNRNHPLFDQLHKSLRALEIEVEDRDLVIFEILASGTSRMNGNDLDPQTAQWLRQKFEVPPDKFAVILTGKDGGIKLDRQDQTRLEEVFNLIDAMPMRQEEMRQKNRTR